MQLDDTMLVTLVGAGISMLAPLGLEVTSDEHPMALLMDDAPAGPLRDDLVPRFLAVRRWQANFPHCFTPAAAAEVFLHASGSTSRWTGEVAELRSDGRSVMLRFFDEDWIDDGSITALCRGFVGVADLGDSLVVYRASWDALDHDADASMRWAVQSARYLTFEDLAVPRTSIFHPALLVSVELPDGWDGDADTHSLTLTAPGRMWQIRSREGVEYAEVLDALTQRGATITEEGEVITQAFASEFEVSLWGTPHGSCGIVSSGSPFIRAVVQGEVDDPAWRGELLDITASLRVHPSLT